MATRKHVAQPYFDYICSGTKAKEGRRVGAFWNEALVGQTLTLFCGEKEVAVKVSGLALYAGATAEEAIRAMLAAEGVSAMLPDASSMEEGVARYLSFAPGGPAATGPGSMNPVFMGAFSLELL